MHCVSVFFNSPFTMGSYYRLRPLRRRGAIRLRGPYRPGRAISTFNSFHSFPNYTSSSTSSASSTLITPSSSANRRLGYDDRRYLSLLRSLDAGGAGEGRESGRTAPSTRHRSTTSVSRRDSSAEPNILSRHQVRIPRFHAP